MRTRRPDRETELRQLLRAPEEGGHNIADYLAAHGAELGIDLPHVSESDDVAAPRLRQVLETRRSERRAIRREGIGEPLREIQREAYWRGDHVVLPPPRVFQVASTAVGKKYVRFTDGDLDVAVASSLLRRAAAALRRFRHVSVSLGADGLHLRWSRGRGGLNFYPQRLRQPADAIVVTLPSRRTTQTMPVLLGEVLGEMGYGI